MFLSKDRIHSIRPNSQTMDRFPVLDICQNPTCKKHGERMKSCAVCRTRYCSRECQVAHWPIHKETCEKKKPMTVSEVYDLYANIEVRSSALYRPIHCHRGPHDP